VDVSDFLAFDQLFLDCILILSNIWFWEWNFGNPS